MNIKLKNIKHLDVSDNELDDSIFMNLSRHNPSTGNQVRSLDISHNQLRNFTTILGFLSICPDLTQIDTRKMSNNFLNLYIYSQQLIGKLKLRIMKESVFKGWVSLT